MATSAKPSPSAERSCHKSTSSLAFDNEAHTLALNRSAWFASKSGFTEIALSNYQGIIDTRCNTDLAYWNAVLDQTELLVEMGLYKRAGNLLGLPDISVPPALVSVPHVYTGRVAMVLAGLGLADEAARLFTDTQEGLIANHLDDAFLVLMYRLHAELCSWQRNYDQALQVLDVAESLLRSTSDAPLLDYKGHICRLRAEIATSTGDYSLARTLLDHARRIAIDMSYDWLAAEVDIGYGVLELEEGHLNAARRFGMSALAIARPSGFVLQQLDALLVLANTPGQSPDEMTTYLALTHNLQKQSGFVWREDRLARLPPPLGTLERK